MKTRPQTTSLPPVPIVLLAAGEGQRFGGIKQLAEIGGEPMVRRAARTALQSGVPVIVVTGAAAERVEAALDGLAVRIVRNADWKNGMGSSLAASIRYLQAALPGATGALLCPADLPLLDVSILTRMLRRHAQAPDRILASRHDGIAGPPVLFPRDCFAALTDWSGSRGAHALLERASARLETFTFDLTADVDTPDDLRRVRERLSKPSD